jgi:glucan 1,3-beta-glucosidase
MRVQQNDGNKQQGIFDENGSGGFFLYFFLFFFIFFFYIDYILRFMSDLIFNGGGLGAAFGNQQFTSRNLTFNQAYHAIQMIWLILF